MELVTELVTEVTRPVPELVRLVVETGRAALVSVVRADVGGGGAVEYAETGSVEDDPDRRDT